MLPSFGISRRDMLKSSGTGLGTDETLKKLDEAAAAFGKAASEHFGRTGGW